MQIAAAQIQSVGNATWAGLAQLHHTAQHELFEKRLLELTRLTTVLAITALIPIAVYNHSFILLWLGAPRWDGETLTILAAINAFLLAVLSLWGWLFSGTGLTQRLVPMGIATAVVNIAASIGATAWLSRHRPELALIGPVLGTTVAFTMINLGWSVRLMRRTFGIQPIHVLRAISGPLLLAIPFAAAVALVSRGFPPRGWPGLVLHLAGSALAFLITYMFLLMDAQERALWRMRLRLGMGKPAAVNAPVSPAPTEPAALNPPI